MMIRTSLSPSEVTPAAYLLPSAMSLSRRAATRGSTTPMRMPLLKAMRRLPSGVELDRVARVDLGELARVGEVDAGRRSRSCRSPRRRSGPGPCCPPGAGTVFSPAATSSVLEPVDVALGDPVRRVERERRLVVLARRAELAQLPERLGQAVLGLGVGAELEQARGWSRRASAHWPAAAWAIACSASWRFVRGQVDGARALVSMSGKVTRRSSFRGAARFGADRGGGARSGGRGAGMRL